MPKSKDSSVQVAVIVAGLLAVVGGAWLFLNSGTDEAIETTQVVVATDEANPVSEVSADAERIPVDTALQMAEMAFQSGHLTGEEEGTAVDFYRQVLDQDPGNARALAGMQLISTQLVDEAEELMAKNDYQGVTDRIEALTKIEAGSDAVLSLQQQFTEKTAGMFTQLDAAIASGQLDRAESLARSLRLIPNADSGRINSAIVTIAQTRKDLENAAAEELALAESRREPQDIPTTETVAYTTSNRVTGEFLDTNTDTQDSVVATYSDGTTLVQTGDEGASLEPVELVDPEELVRNQIASLLEQAEARVDENRLIKPAGDNAVELYNQVLALETTNTEAKRGLRGIVQKLTSSAYDLAEAEDIEGARAVLDSAESVGIAAPLVTQARKDVRSKWLEIESSKVFSVGGFEVEKSVPPKYPKRAMSRSIEGWVKVEFTVAEDGKTRDLQVVESSEKLAKQFSSSAMNAVKQWRFKPRVLDGEVIAQRSETMVQFKLTE